MRERLLSLLPGRTWRAARSTRLTSGSGSDAENDTLPFLRLNGSTLSGRASPALESIAQLHMLLSNPIAGRKLREYLSNRCGSCSIDFLVSYWTFNKSRNALERYQQLCFIAHSLAAEHAPRPRHLSEANRLRLMKEWSSWESTGRVPINARFPALDAAAAEIEQAALKQSGLQLRRTRERA